MAVGRCQDEGECREEDENGGKEDDYFTHGESLPSNRYAVGRLSLTVLAEMGILGKKWIPPFLGSGEQ